MVIEAIYILLSFLFAIIVSIISFSIVEHFVGSLVALILLPFYFSWSLDNAFEYVEGIIDPLFEKLKRHIYY